MKGDGECWYENLTCPGADHGKFELRDLKLKSTTFTGKIRVRYEIFCFLDIEREYEVHGDIIGNPFCINWKEISPFK